MSEHDPQPDASLVVPEGVNSGSALAERDRRPDGVIAATGEPKLPPPASAAPSTELAGTPGQDTIIPGQQTEVGEG